MKIRKFTENSINFQTMLSESIIQVTIIELSTVHVLFRILFSFLSPSLSLPFTQYGIKQTRIKIENFIKSAPADSVNENWHPSTVRHFVDF